MRPTPPPSALFSIWSSGVALRVVVSVLCIVALGACKRPTEPERNEGPPQRTTAEGVPIVEVAPVETVPFEEGYKTGAAKAQEVAKPKAPVPTMTDAQDLAQAEAGATPDRGDKWRSGFAQGYIETFTRIATGKR